MPTETLSEAGVRLLDARLRIASEVVQAWCKGHMAVDTKTGRLLECPLDALELIDELLLERYERA